jgi:hypothetical protein
MVQQMSVLGIDIAKLVLHVVGMDDTGHSPRINILAHRQFWCTRIGLPP